MSALVGTRATKKAAGTTVLPGYIQTPEFVMIDEITAAGETLGSTYSVGFVPKNAVITDFKVYNAALGTGSKLKCGDGTTADKFFAATAMSTAGVTSCNLTTIIGQKLSADTAFVFTSDTAVVTGKIVVVVKYTLA